MVCHMSLTVLYLVASDFSNSAVVILKSRLYDAIVGCVVYIISGPPLVVVQSTDLLI